MAFFTFAEVFDIILMTAIVGYIFKDFFKAPRQFHDPMDQFKTGINWDDFKFAIYAVAPAIIVHEFGHKFVAMGFGLNATFQAAYFFLGLGVLLKLMNFGFIFLIPAYVSIVGKAFPWQFAVSALAGPLVNLVLWLGSGWMIKSGKFRKHLVLLNLTKKINMFLFIFNMLPIPGFDGWQVYSGLIKTVMQMF